jgi:hypothetical protein
MVRLVDAPRVPCLGIFEQIAFATEIEFDRKLGTNGRQEASPGNALLTNKMPRRTISRAVETSPEQDARNCYYRKEAKEKSEEVWKPQLRSRRKRVASPGGTRAAVRVRMYCAPSSNGLQAP